MKVAVISDDPLKEELLAQGLRDGVEPAWLTLPGPVGTVTAVIDLLFDGSTARLAMLKQKNAEIVLINSVTGSCVDLPGNFIRFNGWNTFLKASSIEAAGMDGNAKEAAEKVLGCFNKTIEWVADDPGFISARVVSMIINEAYLALEEGVSSKEEIDTAMKLGTNYPHGPFEWGRLIGLKNIHALLTKLAETNSRYQASVLLQQEAAAT
jgi:3-hydroxybutyryl-CoA dehydrogenase